MILHGRLFNPSVDDFARREKAGEDVPGKTHEVQMEPPRLVGAAEYAVKLTIRDHELFGDGRDVFGGTPLSALSNAFRAVHAFMEETNAWFEA